MLTGRRCGGTAPMSSPSSRMRPSFGVFEAGEQAQQRGLAAAGGPEQREELACADIERERVDRGHRAEALG